MPKVQKTDTHTPPGAFRADGSWNEKGELRDRGPVHAMIRRLVEKRRASDLGPKDLVMEIVSSGYQQAFPSLSQWAVCQDWRLAQTGSSAEEVLKREGRGIEGCHWCGQHWILGSERDCPKGHKLDPDGGRKVQELLTQHGWESA